MTTVFVIDDGLKSYIFKGSDKEVSESIASAYATDPAYRKLIDNAFKYVQIKKILVDLRSLARRSFGLEDKL